jgi:hypothetical protein
VLWEVVKYINYKQQLEDLLVPAPEVIERSVMKTRKTWIRRGRLYTQEKGVGMVGWELDFCYPFPIIYRLFADDTK